MNLWTNWTKTTKVVAILATALILVASISALVFYSQTQPPGAGDNEITLLIPIGTSTVAIANLLEEHGVIKNALLFRLYLRQNEYEGKLQAGNYLLTDGLKYSELSEILLDGQIHRETIRFTIPEGLKVAQVADRLESQGLVDREVFLDLVQNGEFDYWFINQIPQNVDYRLEGYLFPNTYEVFEESTEWDIINIMLRHFDRTFTEEFQNRAQELNMSVHEVVTLAAIVEKEARVATERATIAGVYYNRLEISMKLQADATVQYLFEEQRERVLWADLEIDNPYNTYKYYGLPPGPISGVGKGSIEATLYPESHGYFYYVTKKDGTGEHYFGVTYQDHLANIAKSNRN